MSPCWNDLDDVLIVGPEMIQEMVDEAKVIEHNLKAVQDRQKACADRRWKPLEFKEWDKAFLKVSSVKGLRQFNVKGKLSLYFVRPYDVIEKINSATYCLALPPKLQHVHDVFHNLQLHKYIHEPTHTIVYEPLEVKVDGLTYEEQPVKIVDRRVKQLRN